MSAGKPFGGASMKLLEQVTKAGAGALSVADAGTREAFLSAWVEHLSNHARYLRSKGQTLQAPVAVVYVSDAGAHASAHGWKLRATLGASDRDDMAGRLAASSGETGGCEHSARFKDSGELEDAIRAAGLGDCPTVILATELRLLVWGAGVGSGSQPFVRTLGGGPVTVNLDAIENALAHFYEAVARQTTTWWEDASERITVPKPEACVQGDLLIWLLATFSGAALVRQEDKIGNGRTDLTIQPFDTSGGNQSAVLELKTLRDFHTPKTKGVKPSKFTMKEKEEWATKGLQQTAAYRDDLKMHGAFLCLYDFCKCDGKSVMTLVQPVAAAWCIVAHRYWITASHEEHRAERYPLPTQSSKPAPKLKK